MKNVNENTRFIKLDEDMLTPTKKARFGGKVLQVKITDSGQYYVIDTDFFVHKDHCTELSEIEVRVANSDDKENWHGKNIGRVFWILTSSYDYGWFESIDGYNLKAEHIELIQPDAVDIEIADCGQYKLFTNKSGTRFVAGCRDFTREEALRHWGNRIENYSFERAQRVRAKVFYISIKDYIEKIEGEEMETKMDKLVSESHGEFKPMFAKPTTLEEVQAQRKELDRIEAELKRKPWKPVDGQMYWLVWEDGDIDDNRWEDDRMDMERLEMGNIYKTEAEAEKARDKRKAEVRLRNLIQELGGEIGFKNGSNKAHLFYDHSVKKLNSSIKWSCQSQGTIYFNPDIAGELIKRIPEQDIKLLFDLEV